MAKMDDISVDFTLTDIPYDAVNRQSNGLRSLDKCKADILTFDLNSFLENVYRVTKNSIVIFCGKEQFMPSSQTKKVLYVLLFGRNPIHLQ